jgi:hypothetical protein
MASRLAAGAAVPPLGASITRASDGAAAANAVAPEMAEAARTPRRVNENSWGMTILLLRNTAMAADFEWPETMFLGERGYLLYQGVADTLVSIRRTK